jgi:suppressor for copper-sensitivity B
VLPVATLLFLEINLKYLKTILFVWLFISINLTTYAAQSTSWIENPSHPSVQVRFTLTGELDVKTKTLPALLEVRLSGDWKTYWRTPGEGGIAPSIDWQQSTNIASVDWLWPVPERFSLLGLKTLGYKHQVNFPMLLTVDDIATLTKINGKLTLSSCTNICVLTDYDLSLDVDLTSLTVNSEAMFAYNKAKAQVPTKVIDAPNVSIIWDKNKRDLLVEIIDDFSYLPRLIVDGEPDTVFTLKNISQQQNDSGESMLVAVFLGENWLGAPELAGKSLNVSVISDDVLVEYLAQVSVGTINIEQISLLKILIFALLGGLILNVMPCVLPVLGMKLSSIVNAPTIDRNQIRGQFIASAFGIFVSFWLLAGFVTLLKFSGQAVGWGIQFQNPWFIGFMVVITAIFALNMLGVFEINLPSSLQTKLATVGQNTHKGHFLQGMFATLLATPCSAPFLGTAVAFAFGADSLSLIIVFTALALGMALPWLVVAAFPQLACFFPKPGRWMNIIKIVFSALLLLTSLWLITLLASFVDSAYLWAVSSFLSLIFIFFLGKNYGRKALVSSISFLMIFSALMLFLTANQWRKVLPTDLDWQTLNVATISEQVNQGKTVFVDVTAQWCITCKANKVGVVLQDPVYSALKQPNIILMKGDWTKPSADITDYLQKYQRFGVPFNIVYGPKAPSGITLPVILSSDEVLNAINKAAGNNAGSDN